MILRPVFQRLKIKTSTTKTQYEISELELRSLTYLIIWVSNLIFMLWHDLSTTCDIRVGNFLYDQQIDTNSTWN